MVPSYVLILHTSCEVRGPCGPQVITEAEIKTCGRGVYGAYSLAEDYNSKELSLQCGIYKMRILFLITKTVFFPYQT